MKKEKRKKNLNISSAAEKSGSHSDSSCSVIIKLMEYYSGSQIKYVQYFGVGGSIGEQAQVHHNMSA